MALTVEELQIVLSCDATTAQTVLRQMDATVKAYTDKFQSYFDKLGIDKNPKSIVGDVKAVEKQLDNVTKAIESKGKDWKDTFQKTWGESFEQSMSKVYKNSGEYVPSGDKFIPSESWDRYERMQRQELTDTDLGFGANSFINKIGPALDAIREKASASFSAISPRASAIFNEIGLIAQFTGQKIGAGLRIGAKIGVAALKAPVKVLGLMAGAARRVGGAIKSAFKASLLGRFLKRLGTVMLRMAAMKLIRGTIQGAKQGLEELAKSSESSAKAMNQIKAAGGSIKMALGAALMPIVKALAPLFYNLAGAINTACNAIAQFFAVITGQGSYTATHLSGALDDVASSAGGAGKAVKGMLAEFDELVVIGNRAGGGGGGGGVNSSFSDVVDDVPAMNNLASILREQILGGDWEGVGATLNGELNKISVKIKNFFDNLSTKGYGTKFAQFLNGIFSDPSAFSAAGSALASGLNFVITTVSDFLTTFDVSGLVASTVALIESFVEEVDWMGLGADIGLIVLDVLEWIAGTLIDLDWGQIFRSIFDVVTSAIGAILSNPQRLVQMLKDLILGLVDLLGGLITGGLASIFDAVGLSGLADRITTAWDNAMDNISTSLDSAISNINTSWNSTGTKAENAGTKAKNAFNDAKSAISSTSSKVSDLKNNLNGLPSSKTVAVTVKVNASGGISQSSNQVSVNHPNVNINIAQLASGGLAYGLTPAIIGEYAGARSNPEVVAPLSDLVGILAKVGAPQGGSSEEEMRLLREQNTLLRQIAQKELKLSPSTQLGQVVERSRQLYART